MTRMPHRRTIADYLIIPAQTSVIFRDNTDQPIHRWFRFAEGFSNAFVQFYFNKHGMDQTKTVYEPFMGSGTVGVCAKLLNMNAIGVELNPFMYFISTLKTRFDEVAVEALQMLHTSLAFPPVPTIEPPPFLRNDKHFLPAVMAEVLKIKEAIWRLPASAERDMLTLAFASILLPASNAKRVPSFGYKTKTHVPPGLPYRLFDASLAAIVADLQRYQGRPLGNVAIVNGDARTRQFPTNTADMAITSPPYANGIDYVTDYSLEMGWLDLIDAQSRKTLRDQMIAYDKTRSLVLREWYEAGEYYREANLHEVVSKLEALSSSYWKKDIHLVILKYFDDMYRVFQSTYDVLKPGARFIFVVGDSLFGNVYVPADVLLAIVGEHVGFQLESIELARKRRSGQNRSYWLRETIVSMQK